MRRIKSRAFKVDGGHVHCNYSIGTHGYPQVGWHDDTGSVVMTTVAKAVWSWVYGPVPKGQTIDHIGECKDKLCIEPKHLRLLSNYENARRTHGRDWELGKCARGHDNSELITTSSSRKRCRLCMNEDNRNYRKRNREEWNRKQRDYRASKSSVRLTTDNEQQELQPGYCAWGSA